MPRRQFTAEAQSPQYTFMSCTPEYDADVEALFDQSFGPGRYAKTAERLREANRSLRTCSQLVMIQNRVVAAVKTWPLEIGGRKGAVFCGPVAVAPDHRGSQIGLQLTRSCLDAAASGGSTLAILIGDEPYFGRIGFSSISSLQYRPPGYVAPHRLLAKELQPGSLDQFSGDITVPRGATPATSAK